MTRLTQAARVVCLAVVALWLSGVVVTTRGDETPNPPAPATQSASAMTESVTNLLRGAVQRPYGWGWQDGRVQESDFSVSRRDRLVQISLAPSVTPGAGLTIFRALELTQNPDLETAFAETIRGIIASQDKTGRFPRGVTFGRSAAGNDPPVAEPDRAPTRASLALLLLAADRQKPTAAPDADTPHSSAEDRVVRAASHAARWLLKQQTQQGGWPVAEPPDAPTGKVTRLIRLDTTEYRDSTIALMLASYMLDDATLKKGANAAISQLNLLRLDTLGHPGRGLWGTAYSPNGVRDFKTLPESDELDLRATRNVMLTLLAAHLMFDDASSLELLDKCLPIVERLKSPDGTWPHFPGRSEAQTGVLTSNADTVEFQDLINAIAEVHRSGRGAALETLSAPLDPRVHVAAVLCGLIDDPFVRKSASNPGSADIFAPVNTGTLAQQAWKDLLDVR